MLTDWLKKEVARFQEAPQEVFALVDFSRALPKSRSDFVKSGRRVVRHQAAIEVPPEIFHRIQFRSIRREPFQFKPITHYGVTNIVHGEAAFVGGQTIPEQDDRFRDLAAESFEEVHNIRTLDRSFFKAQSHLDRTTAGCAHQRADGGESLPVEVVNQFRSATAWRPGAAHRRFLGKAALVEENQERALFEGFFLIRGQVRLFQ